MSDKKKQIRDKDLAKAEAALKRAARKARTIAEETKTPLVFYRNGKVVKEFPAKRQKCRVYKQTLNKEAPASL